MLILLLLLLTAAYCTPVAECDVGSYKLCFFSHLGRIGAASYNTNKLMAYVPKSAEIGIKADMPEFISYWLRSPELVAVDDYSPQPGALTVIIESPEHMAHSLQHAAATFSLMNTGSTIMPFSTIIKRVINVHPSYVEWMNGQWAKFWWSFVDIAPEVNTRDLFNITNVVVMQSVGPPFQSGNFFFSKQDAFAFRRRIYARANVSFSAPIRVLNHYTVCIVSRSETRKILNLDGLINELHNNLHGLVIEVVIIKDPGRTYKNNPLELVRIISTCDAYVAVLASELVFQMFMREKTATLEIMPPKWMEFWHNELAYTLGINWVPVYPLHETNDGDYITWYGCDIQDSETPPCAFKQFSKNPGITVHMRSLVKQIARQLRKIIPH